MGRMFFNILATFAEFEADLIRLRTREGMAQAKARGRLKGKQPTLKDRQARELARMHATGDYSISDLAELFSVSRPTVYRTLKLLTEQRRIHPVLLDGETLYEVTGRGHHHHFSCLTCGRVFTLHTCPVELPSGTVYPGGFVVEAHEMTLYGRCPECAAQSSGA